MQNNTLLGLYILFLEEKKSYSKYWDQTVCHPRPQAQKLFLFFGWGGPDLSLIQIYLLCGRNALLLCYALRDI